MQANELNECDDAGDVTVMDSVELAPIAFLLLASQLSDITKVDQVELQEAVLMRAFQLYQFATPEDLESIFAENFPKIMERRVHEN